MGPWTRNDDVMTQSIDVTGDFVDADGLTWYRIGNHDLLDPFLVNLVTPDDQWVFVSSSGALTAGRGKAENALFPYETDDRLHRSGGRAGPLTLIRVDGSGDVWQPFDPDAPIGVVHRSVAKTEFGDRLRFSEYRPDWGMTFTYTWSTAGRFGLVRRCRLSLDADREPVDATVLDGLTNVLPAGVELGAQQASSTLVDAYRRNEVDRESGLALFTLEALVSDKADPAEALRANVIWSAGLDRPTTLLSERQVRRFRSGHEVTAEQLTTGVKGAHLQVASLRLTSEDERRWMTVADAALDHRAVLRLTRFLVEPPEHRAMVVDEHVQAAHRSLVELVGSADGLQLTGDRRATAHHLANVLFNCMRGGLFPDDHRVVVADVADFVAARDRRRRTRFLDLTNDLDPVVDIETLRRSVSADDDLRRLVNEYLPLTFSRRHGDPSRPWNTFRIPAPTHDGRPAIGYQGNWRDIFQNWEALLHSYPLYVESVIAKFVSASTVDGHNPYRITHDGIDWEEPEDGSWGNYGYWGDHQIVYLHRLLDVADRFHPGLLESMINRRSFSYADVPYRLRPYPELVLDSKHTLDFDHDRQAEIDARVAVTGSDGRLVPTADGSGVHLATLGEKLLVPALAKLSNLVAGGGIWMNTQRPEWNDANNALVGNGVSVVTLIHLRDYLRFVDRILTQAGSDELAIGTNVVSWLQGVTTALTGHLALIDVEPSDHNQPSVARDRRSLLDALGLAYDRYRSAAYEHGPGEPQRVPLDEVRRLLREADRHLTAAVRLADRPDGLVHTYWLMRLEPGHAYLDPLYQMFEGQVAAVSSPDSGADDVLSTMSALFDSELHRTDQGSFMLYPNRRLPPFLHKNLIPDQADGSVLAALADHPSGLVGRDDDGNLRFAAHLRSARALEAELDRLAADQALGHAVTEGRDEILAAYEAVFDHRSFTGRSQSMYGYEGLGSIYWHMVSKLVLGLQEQLITAVDNGDPPTAIQELFEYYRRARSGLGDRKSAALQGTFPTDPHSHTPAGMGAQQPGMTGQVKEGVLIRWGELGVRVQGGRLRFDPVLLDPAEFLPESRPWDALGPDSVLPGGSLGFTYCTVPIVYRLDEHAGIDIHWTDGRKTRSGIELDRTASEAVFARSGLIARLDVTVARRRLLEAQQTHR